MQTPNCLNQSTQYNVSVHFWYYKEFMFLFFSASFIFQWSTSIYINWVTFYWLKKCTLFFSFDFFSLRDLYTLVWISYTPAPECNTTANFCLFIFIIHELGLPASSILNVDISLYNILSPKASTWFECTSSCGSCFVELGSQCCLKCVADTGIYCSLCIFFSSDPLLHISNSKLTCLWFLYLCYCMNWSRLKKVFWQMYLLVT